MSSGDRFTIVYWDVDEADEHTARLAAKQKLETGTGAMLSIVSGEAIQQDDGQYAVVLEFLGSVKGTGEPPLVFFNRELSGAVENDTLDDRVERVEDQLDDPRRT